MHTNTSLKIVENFHFSLYPQNILFNYVNWSNYLSLNISESFIVPHSKVYGYLFETN